MTPEGQTRATRRQKSVSVSKTLTHGGSRTVTATVNYGFAAKGATGGGSLSVAVEENWSESWGRIETETHTDGLAVKPQYTAWLEWRPSLAKVHGIAWVWIGGDINHEGFKSGMYAFPMDFDGVAPDPALGRADGHFRSQGPRQ